MVRRTLTIALATMLLTFIAGTTFAGERWTTEKAWDWYKDAGVIKGCNYLPRTATNVTEIWQKETFDPETIDQELGWAEGLGYTSVRINLQFLVWENDRDGLLDRIDTFLEIADKHGIKSMVNLFDDCAFGYPAKTDPYLGPQGDPLPGEYAPYWTPSPGHSMVRDQSTWPRLEKYVKDVVGRFKNDKRILIWDLYNEPTNGGVGDPSIPLVEKTFQWARQINPTQPLTSGPWHNNAALNEIIYRNSDVMTFHSYDDAQTMRNWIYDLSQFGRPIICTEWLLRRNGNTVEEILPVFAEYGVGWYHWGLVAGRTQTYMLWSSKKGDPIPENWQHDIFHSDGTPYRAEENQQLKAFTYSKEKVDLLSKRWSAEKAQKWYDAQPWPCGYNYIPANSISYTEMWMPYNFDPKFIDKELALAEETGFNCLRVILPFVVWEHDPKGFKKRLDKFLDICDKRGQKVMLSFFDDCAFGPITDPVYGKQPKVVPGHYANGWTPSPGHSMVRDKSTWPRLEKYVKDIIAAHKNDDRVWVWDLYNEPTNGGVGDASIPLVEKVFQWARQVDPKQPLTTGPWNGNAALNDIIFRNSDIMTFHDYNNAQSLTAWIDLLKKFNRPIICTEWMARTLGSLFKTHLPIFRKENVGSMHWGLVNGKTQTHYPWGSKAGAPEPKVWFVDLYRGDHTPYDPAEIELIKYTIENEYVEPKVEVLVPTSFTTPETWRYTTTKPAGNWTKSEFDDSGWAKSFGAFGTSDLPTRRARTEWKTREIWLRRTFELESIDFDQLALNIHYDENPKVYINGILVSQLTGHADDYMVVTLDDIAINAIKLGENLIAVSATQTGGGQYIDVGLSEIVNQQIGR